MSDAPYRIDLAALRAERVVAAYGAMSGLDVDAHRTEAVVALLRALWHASCAAGVNLESEDHTGIITWRADARSVAAHPGIDDALRARIMRGHPADADWAHLADAVRTHYRTPPALPPLRIELTPPRTPRDLAGAGDLALALHRTICADDEPPAGYPRLLADLHHLGSWRHLDVQQALDAAYDAFHRDLLGDRPHVTAAVRRAVGSLGDALDADEVPSAGEWEAAVTLLEDLHTREARLRDAEATAPVIPLDDALFGSPGT